MPWRGPEVPGERLWRFGEVLTSVVRSAEAVIARPNFVADVVAVTAWTDPDKGLRHVGAQGRFERPLAGDVRVGALHGQLEARAVVRPVVAHALTNPCRRRALPRRDLHAKSSQIVRLALPGQGRTDLRADLRRPRPTPLGRSCAPPRLGRLVAGDEARRLAPDVPLGSVGALGDRGVAAASAFTKSHSDTISDRRAQ